MCPQLDYEMQEPSSSPDERLIINADQSTLEDGGLSTLAGAVRLKQGDKEFSAQKVEYDDQQRQVHVRMESLFRNRSLIVKSKRVDFDLNTETGVFSDTQFTLPERAARGDASIITLNKEGNAEFRLARYTTCAPGSKAWYLEARDIRLDHDEGLGTADNARLRFLGVPVLYMPWFQFPIDDRRRTGLLFPTIGQSGKTGFDVRWPVYINWAPNYDTTLTPRVMTKRGLQLGSDTRYLLQSGEGHARFDFLNHDAEANDARSYFELSHVNLINQRLSLETHLAQASDREYFEDFGGAADAASTVYLDRSILFTYQAPSAYLITALAQDYQTISNSVLPADEPYRRLPQLQLRMRTKSSIADTRAGLFSEYTNFRRANDTQNPQGQRINLQPYLLTEVERNTWFFNSETSFNYTQYELTDTLPGSPSSLQRSLPQFSAGAGLRFERLTSGGRLQTLEPEAYYLYSPFRDQTLLPLFDSGEPDFDFTQLFARNRFSGEDRVSDANHLAIAATSRLLDPNTGEQKLAASFGQLFRFKQPQVTLPGATVPREGAADFIAGLDYRIARAWSALLTSQWSPDDGSFSRNSVAVRYREDQRLFMLAYRYRQSILEQADVAASFPLNSTWRLTGRQRYSLRDSDTLDTLLGVEYSTCCWAVQTSYRRFIANTRGEFDSGVYMQLNLKGLTRLGSGYASLENLEQSSEEINYR